MMMEKMNKALNFLRNPITHNDQMRHSAENEYTDGARLALKELHAAEHYFNSVSDPYLIEYALYEIEAARRKYEYLMRKLRSGEAAWENKIETL